MSKKHDTQKFLLRLFKALGIICFVVAAALIAVVIVMHIDKVQVKYEQYLGVLDEFEQKVANLDNKWLIMIVILLLYILRSLSPIYPLPIVWIISGMVFSPVHSFLINLAGMCLINAFRYYTGVQMGEGYWNKVIKRHDELIPIFDVNAKINPLVLLTLRAVPIFPYNTVSHLYGTFGYPFVKYMLITAAVLIPRLIPYSFLGNSVYDPLSSSFYIPLTVIMVFTGISFFFLRFALKAVFRYSSDKNGSAGNDNNETSNDSNERT